MVTVNDYLARRDANWMAPIYRFLGMSVGVILPNQDLESKRAGYAADITYGTNNEFGFDYLRDNMVFSLEDRMQREPNFAIVDEVDSILIDEARTPLIISGAAEDSSRLYKHMNVLVPRMTRGSEEAGDGHFVIDEKLRQVELTEEGHLFIEQMLISEGLLPEGESLYHAINLGLLHHVHTALRAHHLFHRDVEYIVQNGQVVLIDEHTGRTMAGRRLSEGLHQAIEAKEGVHIQSESHTLASTTFQNYFRLYGKLAGMTGTADTEAFEFRQIYGLDVVVIPTNKPTIRKDLNDLVYLTKEEKFEAVVADIQSCTEKGAPVLVGTASIETSEELSSFLQKQNIAHQVLNAKYHEREAEIIAQAGRPATVTIATNMAGRGTDIVLGGNLEAELAQLPDATPEQVATLRAEWQQRHQRVLDAGGLHIIGTERHESRRIDNQLRGRAGRQGDPGLSRFYLSLEDNLMRIFASDRVKGFMQKLGMQRGEAIEHRMVSNAIEKAQRKVEGRNFDIRKQLLEYDDVANDQRRVIYQQRNELLASTDVSDTIAQIRADVVNGVVSGFIPPQTLEEQWNVAGLEQHLHAEYGLTLPIARWLEEESGSRSSGCASASWRQWRPAMPSAWRRWGPTCTSSSATSCCRCSTRCGRTTCRRWMRCARASTCAPTLRATPSRSTSARRSSCSRSCWRTSSTRSSASSPRCRCAARRRSKPWSASSARRRSARRRARATCTPRRPNWSAARRLRPRPRGLRRRRPPSPSCATCPRSGATSPAPAVRARNTSSATGRSPERLIDFEDRNRCP